MNTMRCPRCDELLSESASYCADCGESLLIPGQYVAPPVSGARLFRSIQSSPRALAGWGTIPLSQESANVEEDGLASEWRESGQSATWQKEVVPSSDRAKKTPPLPPRPMYFNPSMLHERLQYYHLPPNLLVWVGFLICLLLVFGGLFGVVAAFGQTHTTLRSNELSLQVLPNVAAVGATVMLKGVNFSPLGKIGLWRDAALPIEDTSNLSLVQSDKSGRFTDTVAIPPDWEAGSHTFDAEDMVTHKIASFTIVVTGHAVSLRPAHLRVSADTLDLGTGDQATNTVKTITLTNIGEGQISWLSNSTQDWLALSPNRGVFANGQSARITVALDRSKMDPGSYHAQVNVWSNAGNSIILVSAEVTPLLVVHQAVLQLTPALLSFTATDGGVSPPSQQVIVGNPGLYPLQWQATTNADWLSISPSSATVDPSAAMPVAIGVNGNSLLPGSYSAMVTFSTLGAANVLESSQSVAITVTIPPPCSLQVTPGMLNFTSVSPQAAPTGKVINIGASQHCNIPIAWTAVSNAPWLVLSATHGSTPATPSVHINVATLHPGTYKSTIIFSSASSTQTLPVTFLLSPATAAIPLEVTAPATLVFNGVVGQAGSTSQTISIAHTGASGVLTWKVTVPVDANWLTVSPATGTLAAHQAVTLTVAATILSTLAPGTYKSTVTISAVDGSGRPASNSPQIIPVSLFIKEGCTAAVAQSIVNLVGVAGQAVPSEQQVAIQAGAACSNPLQVAVVSSGGTWLTATPVNSGSIKVSAALVNLSVGNYSGTVTITVTDSVTHQAIGQPLALTILLGVQAPCALQIPSPAQEAFSAPGVQTFTIDIAGSCTGNVAITPQIIFGSATGWLTVTPGAATVPSGGSQTFTITVTTTPQSNTTASIILTATDNGVVIANSPQTVSVTMTGVVPTATSIAHSSPSPTLSSVGSQAMLSVNPRNRLFVRLFVEGKKVSARKFNSRL